MSKERFSRTVAILVKAYLNGTLAHGSCSACAVGNLVAHELGTQPRVDINNMRTGFLNDEFENGAIQQWYNYNHLANHDELKVLDTEQTRLTGYSPEELNDIEFAFEGADGPNLDYSLYYCAHEKPIGQDEEWMFNGLMACVSVLASIDGISLEETEEARKMFVKA